MAGTFAYLGACRVARESVIGMLAIMNMASMSESVPGLNERVHSA